MPLLKKMTLKQHVSTLTVLGCFPHAGTLDQGVGTLEVFEEAAPDPIYPGTLETFDNLGRVVESLAGTAK